MGLYDGASATEESGSTAEIAKWLDAPVLLVADVRGMGRFRRGPGQGICGVRS